MLGVNIWLGTAEYRGIWNSLNCEIPTLALTFANRGVHMHDYDTLYILLDLQVHLRSARRILKLCETNKGFYIKAGQFVGSLRYVPKEYSSMLSCLQDQVYVGKFIRQMLHHYHCDLPMFACLSGKSGSSMQV